MSLKIQRDTRLISTTTLSEGEGRKGSGNYAESHEYSSNGLTYKRTYRNSSESTFTRKTSGSSSGGSINIGSRALEMPLSSRLKRALGAYKKELECDEGFRCIQIRCRVGPLTTDTSTNVFIQLHGRVYSDTLKSNKFRRNYSSVKSKLVSRVAKLPYNLDPSFIGFQKKEIVTKIEVERGVKDSNLSEPTVGSPWYEYYWYHLVIRPLTVFSSFVRQ